MYMSVHEDSSTELTQQSLKKRIFKLPDSVSTSHCALHGKAIRSV